jgi:LuxR family maltose regulon positive regulatory protein
MMSVVLLHTKLYPPAARAALVARPRLLARLDALLRPDHKLALICAPAGFGKTTLLADWLASLRLGAGNLGLEGATATQASSSQPLAPRVAWISLDAGDNDPIRFWLYVGAALDAVEPGVADAATALLQAPQPPPVEALLITLLNGVSHLSRDIILVLDDYHVIETPALHDALAFFLDHLPPRVHLVVATRVDPPLPLARLRARGELTELRAADLRFTPAEAAVFLQEVMGVALTAEQIAALERRTEGWVAGLQLAALAMRDRRDLDGFVSAFMGSNRFVVDYLAEEVFARQPPHMQAFLLQTAILDRLCGPLCDAILGVGDQGSAIRSALPTPNPRPLIPDAYSQLLLDQLERANLFLTPLDDARRWYRYHHLFGEVLRERLLSGATQDTINALHRRASRWFEEQRLMPEAIDYALRAADWEEAARLIEAHAITAVLGREAGTLGRWLAALPPAVRRAHARLLVAHAWEYLSISNFAPIGPLLADAEAALAVSSANAPALQHEIDAIRIALRLFDGDPRAVTVGQQVLDNLPAQHPARRAMAGWLGYALFSAGDLAGASRTLEAALALEQELKLVQLALMSILAAVRHAQGRLNESVELCQATLRLAEYDGQLLPVPSAALALLTLGTISLERDDVDDAERQLRRCAGLAHQHGNAFMARLADFYLGVVQEARGDLAGALRQVEAALAAAAQQAVPTSARSEMDAYRTLLWVRLGQVAEARAWVAAQRMAADRPPLTVRDYDRIARIHILLIDRRWAEARAAIDELGQVAERTGHRKFLIWSLVLETLLGQALGDAPAARAAVARALTLAEPEGFARILLNEGAAMVEMLGQIAAGESPAAAYAGKLLATSGARSVERGAPSMPADAQRLQAGVSPLPEPISERELEILGLIAAGQSNQEIADTLIIAVSTVKKHINNLYGKLAVGSRTQALVRARELGLL